mmetsp:Transcript_22132/g.43013  ORF Transcript_22132/g.43013 Transcript_22132/m.43013 type:complete len:115 (-) Transcript_22132:210-554(-)
MAPTTAPAENSAHLSPRRVRRRRPRRSAHSRKPRCPCCLPKASLKKQKQKNHCEIIEHQHVKEMDSDSDTDDQNDEHPVIKRVLGRKVWRSQPVFIVELEDGSIVYSSDGKTLI